MTGTIVACPLGRVDDVEFLRHRARVGVQRFGRVADDAMRATRGRRAARRSPRGFEQFLVHARSVGTAVKSLPSPGRRSSAARLPSMAALRRTRRWLVERSHRRRARGARVDRPSVSFDKCRGWPRPSGRQGRQASAEQAGDGDRDRARRRGQAQRREVRARGSVPSNERSSTKDGWRPSPRRACARSRPRSWRGGARPTRVLHPRQRPRRSPLPRWPRCVASATARCAPTSAGPSFELAQPGYRRPSS